MLRKLLIFAGALALAAPLVHAQGVTICVFQAQKGHKVPNGSDATGVANALSTLTLPKGGAIRAIPVNGVSAGDEEAAAQKQGCAFVAEVWRSDVPASTPMAASASANPSSSSTAGVYPTGSDIPASTVLEYSLKKAGSDKKIAHGEADKSDPWAQAADTIAKKIAKAQ